MELKTRYQYTYFIYPYIIDNKKYKEYIASLIKNKNCEIKIFDKDKDLEIYSYFLPKMRKYIFPTFDMKINKTAKINVSKLAKQTCCIFDYKLKEDIQGKAGKETNGIFFDIKNIEIICFNSGICFLSIKTNVEDSKEFQNILNFNYKFRNIKAKKMAKRQFDNIKIQTNSFEDIKKFTDLVEELTCNSVAASELNIDIEKFFTYSYTCLEQESWNSNNPFSNIEHEFYKYCNVLPSVYNLNLDKISKNEDIETISKWEYIKIGFSKTGSCLLTSAVDTYNYTKLPFNFEKKYLYQYIFLLYKKIYLNKLNYDYIKEKKSTKLRKKFLEFTQNIWIYEITSNDIGSLMYKNWSKVLELDKTYFNIKNEYDLIYKESNLDKTSKVNRSILLGLVIVLIINILNIIF